MGTARSLDQIILVDRIHHLQEEEPVRSLGPYELLRKMPSFLPGWQEGGVSMA